MPAANILPGHGADELIDLLCRLILGPGDAIVDCPPTFGMYGFDAGLAGATVAQVWRRPDFSVDVNRIRETVLQVPGTSKVPGTSDARVPGARRGRPKLLFLTSPNNPDGSLLAPEALRQLLELPVLVVVDEAYIEFAGLEHSVAQWVLEHDNLIVLRTFSKWAGIAGLRLGYGIFPNWLMPVLWKAKQPYNVNVAATVAGLASLSHRAEIQPAVDALHPGARAADCGAGEAAVPPAISEPGQFRALPGGGTRRGRPEGATGGPGHPRAALRQAGPGELHPGQRGSTGADGRAAGGFESHRR